LFQAICSSKNKFPLKEAIIYREEDKYKKINFRNLYNYINSLSDYLKEYQGKTIAIIGNNKLEYAVSLLSVLCHIGNAFLIDKELSKEDILEVFKQASPDLIILDDEINVSFRRYKTIYFSEVSNVMRNGKKYKYDKTFSGNLILHTSGTTGKPKCISLSEKNYFTAIPELNNKWNVTSDMSCLLIIPLYHIYALTSFFHGLYAGFLNILEWDYRKIDDVLRETKPALFMGVPLMYNKIKDKALNESKKKIKIGILISKLLLIFKIDIRKKVFKQIHEYFGGNYIFGCSAGSLLSFETNKFFNDIGLPLYNVYGMTETSGPIAINYKNNNRYKSVGKILDINKIKIVNKNENNIGNIYVKGKNVFDGYINDKKRPYMLDGYFDTGDIGYVKDGFLYVIGRSKNILIGPNGKNISPEEIKRKILKNKDIYDCNIIMENYKLTAVINTNLNHDEANRYIEKINKKLPNYKKIAKVKITHKNIK